MRKLLFSAITALILLSGCVNRDELRVVNIDKNGQQLKNLTASFEGQNDAQTKTYIEDGKLRWHESDQITAFYGNTLNRKYMFTGKTGANGGDFAYVPNQALGTGNPLSVIYSVYPYMGNTVISDEGVISADFPSIQKYSEGSFGKDANLMVAATTGIDDTFLPFKNVGGYLKIRLYSSSEDKLKKLVLKGNNEEKISGPALITHINGAEPAIEMESAARNSITLDCGEGIALGKSAETATELWIVVPPTTFTNGITIEAYSDNSGRFVKSSASSLTIERNTIESMAAVECVYSPYEEEEDNEMPNDEDIVERTYVITYTTNDGQPTNIPAQYKENCTNTYEDGVGTLTINSKSKYTQISSLFFQNCSTLVTVNIPEGVEYITSRTFENCINLTTVTLPESLTGIGGRAFYGCSKLSTINFPSKLSSIGSFAFGSCTSLSSITLPESLLSIGSWAFDSCTSLETVHIPNSVESLGYNPFSLCSNISSFSGKFSEDNGKLLVADNIVKSFAPKGNTTCNLPEGVTTIDIEVFKNATSLTSITIPEGVEIIYEYAFSGCSGLSSVSLPSSLEIIDQYAFENCTSLQTINIPSKTRVVSNAFIGCPQFAKTSGTGTFTIVNNVLCSFSPADPESTAPYDVTIPDGVISIEAGAFDGCTYLNALTIPESVIAIEDGAFTGYNGSCPNIILFTGKFAADNGRALIVNNRLITIAPRGLTSYNVPSGVTSIAGNAFKLLSNITSITLPEGVTSIGSAAFAGCTSLKAINIPSSVKTIENFAFDLTGLTSIVIPEGVTNIGEYAFQNSTSLASITLPNSLTSLGAYAFNKCSKLSTISIPSGLTTIGTQTFMNCTSLNSIVIPSNIQEIQSYAFAGCESLNSVKLENGIKTIGDAAFYECPVTLLTIPESVNFIGFNAFQSCKFLKEVTINSSSLNIDGQAFDGCINLTDVRINGTITHLGDGAFAYCPSLVNITLPDGLTNIGETAFLNCTSLVRISIPESVTTISSRAFEGCTSLSGDLTLPKKLVKISSYLFNGCHSLNKVIIPENVKSIGEAAFQGCSSLKEIVIPKNVTTIGQYAFDKIGDSDKIIYCKADTPPAIFENTFTNPYISFGVPATSIQQYRAADFWKEYQIYGFNF